MGGEARGGEGRGGVAPQYLNNNHVTYVIT